MAFNKLEFAQFGDFDKFTIYRSLSPIETNNLPIPLVTNIKTMFYVDNAIEVGRDYHYLVACHRGDAVQYSTSVLYAFPLVAATNLSLVSSPNGNEQDLIVSWSNPNAWDVTSNVYISTSTFTTDTLPIPIIATGNSYTLPSATEGTTYYVMVELSYGVASKFSELKQITMEFAKPTGFWALAVACWGTAQLPQFNKDLTTEPTWPANFGRTKDFIAYTRGYNNDGSITSPVIPTKTISSDKILNQRFELVVSAGTYNSNYGRMFLEFLDASDNVLAALKVDKASNNFGSTLQIGHTLATVANVPSVGTYPAANGYLDILPTGIKYTPSNPAATTKFNEYTFTKNMSAVSKIRVSMLAAYQPHSRYAAGNPTGSSAYVYLKLI